MWTSFQKACQKHILIPINGVQKKISQKVLLLQDSQAATADGPEDRAPGSWGWLSWGHYCTQSNCAFTHTHTRSLTHRHTERLVADNSHPVISNCSLLMYWAATPYTQLSGPRPPLVPHCRHREAAKELLQLCRTNTEISLPEKHIILSEMS